MEPLRVSLVDMNNGVPNEAVRCFRRLLEGFSARVRAANPRLSVVLEHVQPRNLGELPSRNADLVLSSGGPGSPHDGWEEPWCTAYRVFLDTLLDRAAQDKERAPKAFVVCHSFEIAVQHFRFAEMTRRHDLKFAHFSGLPHRGGRKDGLSRALRRAALCLGTPALAGGGLGRDSAGPAAGRGAGHREPARAEGQRGGAAGPPLRARPGGDAVSPRGGPSRGAGLDSPAASTPPRSGTPTGTPSWSG